MVSQLLKAEWRVQCELGIDVLEVVYLSTQVIFTTQLCEDYS